MADPNQAVQGLLEEMVSAGDEIGLQVAAYHHGELVVDAWAGLADRATGKPVDGETLFTVFSCSKGITATVIHMLAERGLIAYDSPVAKYWPEFAANGKETVTVRQVMSHTAGIPALPVGATPEDLTDWDGICRGIAALAPVWTPGTRIGYHARTYGYILGEVAQRVDDRPFARIVAEDICAPLGISSLFFGLPDEAAGRVAALEDGPRPADPAPPDSLRARVFPPNLPATAALFNRPTIRRACIPSSGGIMSARALARCYAALIGPVDGVRLVSPAQLALATEPQAEGMDLVSLGPARPALGYALGGPLSPMGARPTCFGHGGSGGSIGFADPEHGLAVGFTKTLLRTEADPTRAAAYRIARRIRDTMRLPA